MYVYLCVSLQASEGKLEALECELETLREIAGGGDGDQKDMFNRLVTKVARLEMAAAENEAKRRQLLNDMIDLKGNIRVFCRVRPLPSSGPTGTTRSFTATSTSASTSMVVHASDGGRTLSVYDKHGKAQPFTYDAVFGPQASQEDVFRQVSELVQSALDGYKVCLFSYGQTGAGKTHTMQGDVNHPLQRGIIPRAVEQILDGARRLEEQGWKYTFEASFIEIYNETLRDLLAGGKQGTLIEDKNAIKHDLANNGKIIERRTKEGYKDVGIVYMYMCVCMCMQSCIHRVIYDRPPLFSEHDIVVEWYRTRCRLPSKLLHSLLSYLSTLPSYIHYPSLVHIP